MAYFLGRDVELAITTEHNNLGVVFQEALDSTDEVGAAIVDFTTGTSVNIYGTAEKANLFAGPRAAVSATEGPWGDITPGNATTKFTDDTLLMVDAEWNNEPDNLTAIDLSMGVMDEDVAFIGQRNVLKAEVKKENTISITRKKKDAMWDCIYNDARFGLAKDQTVAPASPHTSGLFDGMRAPDYADCGYRVYIRFKDETSTLNEGEIFVLRNCYVTEHSISMSADSTQEETLTLMSYVDPVVATGSEVTHAAGSNALIAATATTEL
jgi:hypothetical protein|tara:strand:+ start:94 stop:894 length:801 start_codon:yes stop_codon:yes gene_type:complete